MVEIITYQSNSNMKYDPEKMKLLAADEEFGRYFHIHGAEELEYNFVRDFKYREQLEFFLKKVSDALVEGVYHIVAFDRNAEEIYIYDVDEEEVVIEECENTMIKSLEV